jgi:hypothetical protein
MKNKLRKDEFSLSEMLILPDGRILAQNITPMMAKLLSKLDPNDGFMRERARAGNKRGLIHKAHKKS